MVSRKPWIFITTNPSIYFSKVVLAILLALTVAACGGGGASSKDTAPVAAALVVGQGQDQVNITVRSGGEIVLNGENSDGTTFPLDQAVWRQTDSTGVQVDLAKRTELSRSVRVPQVTTPTTLTFELTVTNTDGDTQVTPVSINIVPVNDKNRFLEFFRLVPGEYSVVAALQPGTTITSDVEFRVTQHRLVDYPDRTSADNTPNQFNLEIGTPVIRSTKWLAGTTANWSTLQESVNAFYHPNLCFDVPKLDIDDINLQFDDTDPDRGIADHHRDSVNHYVKVELEVISGTCENSSGDAIDCAEAAVLHILSTDGQIARTTASNGNADKTVDVAALTTSIDALGLQPESVESATAYYAAVDPFDRRRTLNDWLDNAGFLDGSGELIEETEFDHTLYINNYDLGFTRDMFVRKNDDGHVFAYVTNYPALRPATRKEDAVATVAMEFSPPDQDSGAEPFVKFFVFVPNGDDQQQRVRSLNFDGRGEKWVPGACVACHGGELKNLQADGTYPADGDIDAAFLPWDIDSLLFVDANDPDLIDPLVVEGFKVNPSYIDAAQFDRFSLENQQAAFRGMNEYVLSTMPTAASNPLESARFELVREQIHGWYGDTDPATFDTNELPAVNFNGRGYIQPGWAEAGFEDVYHDVFAKHCRICHSQALDINQFATFEALTSILPTVQRFLYEDGVMPNARLDMDRFWVDFRGAAQSPAQRLANALGIDPALATGPGHPIARIKGAKIQSVLPRANMVSIDGIAELPNVENEDGIRLDGTISAFADSYQWEFTERPPGSSAQLIGDDTAKPAFSTDAPGRYVVQLTVNNELGPTSIESITIDASATGPKLAAGATGRITIPESIPSSLSVVTLSSTQLRWIDADSSADNLTYTVTEGPTRGSLSTSVFTQADVNSGSVSYTQATDNDGPTDTFTYTIADETANSVPGQSFDITITTLNDEPVQRNNGPLNIAEGGSSALDTVLLWTDVDNTPTYTLNTPPSDGELTLSSTVLNSGDTFSQAAVDSGRLIYTHDDLIEDSTDSFTYSVGDGIALIGPNTFPIIVANVNDVPKLFAQNLTLEAGRSERIQGELSNSAIPMTGLGVTDSDTLDASDIVLTLTSAPIDGHLEIRTSGSANELIIGESFSFADVTSTVPADGLFYVNNIANSSLLDPILNDSFSISVADISGPGGCGNGLPNTPCEIFVTVNERTDGPTGPSNPTLTLEGFLDPAIAQNGISREAGMTPPMGTPASTDDVPWGDILVNESTLNYVDSVITGSTDDDECPLEYQVTSVPPGNIGFLKVGNSPLTGPADPRILEVGDEFTHAQVTANQIYYENRQVGGSAHSFGLEIRDCLVSINRTLSVTRQLDFTNDIGWVIKTIWTDASTINPVPFGCSIATATQRGCRNCHAAEDTRMPPDSANCAAFVDVMDPELGTDWISDQSPTGTLNCEALKTRADNTRLLTYPTGSTLSHPGERVFRVNTIPHLLLQNWASTDAVCP